MDRATTAVLHRLRCGPASTVQLQRDLFATHVAKQILDLRRTGYLITTLRLPNGVAQYRLVAEPGSPLPPDYQKFPKSEPDVPVGAGRDQSTESRKLPAGPPAPSRAPVPQPAEFIDVLVAARAAQAAVDALTRRPQFGDPALLREMRPKGRR